MPRLTGKQKQEIIARYLAGESQNKLAKQFGVSHSAISLILKDKKLAETCNNLKVENYASTSEFSETLCFAVSA